MSEMGIVQARTPESVKENAADILDRLGLNMSTYINMALNQLIIQKGIPFTVNLEKEAYLDTEKISEVAATLSLENMQLDEEDFRLLKLIKSGKLTTQTARDAILSEVSNGGC